MATPIDLGILESFSSIFVFIFVFAISYAVLGLTGVLGKDNKSIAGIVAFCIAIFLTISLKPRLIIMDMVPWFAMVIVFFMFLLLMMRYVFGDKGDSILKSVMGTSESAAGWWVFLIVLTIFLVSLSSNIGQDLVGGSNTTTNGSTGTTTTGSTETGNWQSNVLNAIYHPKMLGAVIVLVIAIASITLLSKTNVVK